MWKSLFVTRGEVIVFMDADLLDWDTHFVPGLLGPLLTRPEVAAGQGLLRAADGLDGDDAVPFEGGRVTELVARPLIRLLFPELAGLHQPLAGEWAVRRSLFETLQRAARVRRRAGRAGRHRCAPAGSTRSRRSTSAPARTGTSRCATSAAWSTQILAAALARVGAGPDGRGAAAGGERRDDAATGPADVRRRRHADDGDRQPHPRLLLRQGRDLGRGPAPSSGSRWSSTQGAEIVDIGGIKAAPGVEIDDGRGDGAGRRLRGPGARGVPGRW